MAFIHTIPPADAEGRVRELYQQAQDRFGYVPNWTQAFSLRPGVLDGWTGLLRSIQSSLSVRSYELATLAAARALRSSYCALAHGSVLADKVSQVAGNIADINILYFTCRALNHLDLTFGNLLANCYAERNPDEIGIFKLHAGTFVAVI